VKKKSELVRANVDSVYQRIRDVLAEARGQAYRAVNFAMVRAYWNIGRIIVEEEQKGRERAEYGQHLIAGLSQRLSAEFHKGFDKSNLWNMRSFFLTFPKIDAVRQELAWTHYRLLLRVDKAEIREFYMNEAINSNWSTRELERQMSSLLFERLALSKDREGLLRLSRKGQILQGPEDLVKDPYVLEFLGLEKHESLPRVRWNRPSSITCDIFFSSWAGAFHSSRANRELRSVAIISMLTLYSTIVLRKASFS